MAAASGSLTPHGALAPSAHQHTPSQLTRALLPAAAPGSPASSGSRDRRVGPPAPGASAREGLHAWLNVCLHKGGQGRPYEVFCACIRVGEVLMRSSFLPWFPSVNSCLFCGRRPRRGRHGPPTAGRAAAWVTCMAFLILILLIAV